MGQVRRHLEVDDHAHILDVQPSRRHVCGHQDRGAARPEIGEDALALALLLVAVHGVAADLAGERALQRITAALGRAEDEHAGTGGKSVDLTDEVLVFLAPAAGGRGAGSGQAIGGRRFGVRLGVRRFRVKHGVRLGVLGVRLKV